MPSIDVNRDSLDSVPSPRKATSTISFSSSCDLCGRSFTFSRGRPRFPPVRRSTLRNPTLPAVARTSGNIRWPRSPLARALLAAAGLDKTSRPPHRYGSIAVRCTRQSLYQKCNLLKARVIIYAYQHVRLLSPEPLVVKQPKFTRIKEPTLLCNQVVLLRFNLSLASKGTLGTSLRKIPSMVNGALRSYNPLKWSNQNPSLGSFTTSAGL